MVIPRPFYLNKLIDRRGNGLIKVITGVRRCGKSFLLNNIFSEHLASTGVPANHIIRFAFDSADDLVAIGESPIAMQKQNRGANPEKFMAYINAKIGGAGEYYLLLDEVQLLDCFESVLNGYVRKTNIDLYVTGSNAKFLSSDIITEFAGRGDEIRMYPLSFAEFMRAYGTDKYAGFAQYMLYGGIPSVVLRPGEADKANLLSNLFKEIYLRDIVSRHRIRNTAELEDLLNILASGIGAFTNPEKLRKSSISINTITKYIACLEDSFLIESAQKFNIKGRAYVSSPKKYYFTDLGLRNARLNFRQNEPGHAMENIIYNEMRMRGYAVDVGVVPATEKDANGNSVRKQTEVDFVCNLGSSRYYIQSAYALPDAVKRAQETRPLRLTGDSFKKIIITAEPVSPSYDDYGILTLNVYDFLLNPQSIAF